MGQKVNPISNRLGYIKNWESRYFAGKKIKKFLLEDVKIRQFIKDEAYAAGISKIEIERIARYIRITIFAARPGIIIGRRGESIENLKKSLEEIVGDKKVVVTINSIEKPETDAQLIAEGIALQLQKNISYQRAMNKSIANAINSGVEGIKIKVQGRLGGAEIARFAVAKEGRIPLSTFKADIDYGFAQSKTTYGIIGVKAWVYKGQVNLKKHPEISEIKEGEGKDAFSEKSKVS